MSKDADPISKSTGAGNCPPAELNDTLDYGSETQALSPGYARVSLAFALMPVIAYPFLPLGRAFDLPVLFLILGAFLAPFNLVTDCYLLRRYPGGTSAWVVSLVSLILSAGVTLLLGTLVALIAINGPPC